MNHGKLYNYNVILIEDSTFLFPMDQINDLNVDLINRIYLYTLIVFSSLLPQSQNICKSESMKVNIFSLKYVNFHRTTFTYILGQERVYIIK